MLMSHGFLICKNEGGKTKVNMENLLWGLNSTEHKLSKTSVRGFPGGSTVKSPPAMQETWFGKFDPWVGKIAWRRKWWFTPVFLPGKAHGQKSLASYGLGVIKESDTSERLNSNDKMSVSFYFCHPPRLVCSVPPLIQRSCLENPRDQGAWWAAIYGVAQSRTRLERLSSSRSTPHLREPSKGILCSGTHPREPIFL